MVLPAVTPETTPLEFMVATDVLVLLHVPDAVASLKWRVAPEHTVLPPVIAAGSGLMVTVALPLSATDEQAVVVMLTRL